MTTIDYAIRVAMQLQNAGKWEPAEIILTSILDVCPTHAQALHLSGVIAYQTGKMDVAIHHIQQAIASDATIALFHSNLGEMYRQLNDLALSIQCGERAITLDPNSAVAWSNLGIAYFDTKHYDSAENCHKRALAIDPKLSCSLNNMGSIYKTQGKIAEAVAFYQAAIAAAPHFVEPLNNLGVLFLQQQEFKHAFTCLQQAIKLAPTFTDAHCNMGLALLGLDHSNEALLYFEKALQFKPDYAEAYYGMAKVYLQKQDFIEAEHFVNKAIAINSQQMEFHQLLAEILHGQGKNAQALKYLDQTLAIDPTFAHLYISKGNILMEMGDTSAAYTQFAKIADDPAIDTRVFAHYCLAQLSKVKSDNPHLPALLAIANTIQDVSPHKQEYVYFALGKYHDDMGDYAKAFTYFSQGCNLKRKRITYNITEQAELTNKLIRTFTRETIEYLRAFANPSALPIFIVGMPRSGTTLVEQVLASHPEVQGAGELKYFNDLVQLHLTPNLLPPANYHAITEKYLSYLRRISSEANRITDKMPHNFNNIGVIHALFPNAKIIHVKRNPIDTCLSCYTKLFSEGHFYSYDLTELGHYYNCYEQIMEHWRSILPADAWLDVDYENVIHDVETEAKRLIAYCDLTWDPACLAFYQSKRNVRTASFLQVRQPVYTSSVNRWRRFENELGPLIEILYN